MHMCIQYNSDRRIVLEYTHSHKGLLLVQQSAATNKALIYSKIYKTIKYYLMLVRSAL